MAVLVVPFCVVLAWMMGQPLDLNFNAFEVRRCTLLHAAAHAETPSRRDAGRAKGTALHCT